MHKYKAEDELLHTNLLIQPEEIKEFCEKIVKSKVLSGLRVMRIGKDETIEASKEHFVWLVDCKNTSTSSSTCSQLYQLPLTPFVTALADKFEEQITTTTFTFVADASAQTASHVIAELIKSIQKQQQQQQQQQQNNVLIVERPFWMVCLAALMEQRIYSNTTLERAIFALCRLEAMQQQQPSASTVLVILPGQAVVPQLLPLLQSVFPDDRHVFCYTGCINTTRAALMARRKQRTNKTKIPSTWDEALSFDDSIVYTTPLSVQQFHKSTNLMLPYAKAVAALPLTQADTVETWMAAVDAYFVMKEDERRNGYLPYVCKIDYLWSGSTKDQHWALRSLLQYVTGSRSREFPAEQLQAAKVWLKEYCHSSAAASSSKNDKKKNDSSLAVGEKAIENAVFQHKLILIENKTLKDTVQPAEHWTLKAAVKRGCACCLPEEDEEEEDTAGVGTSFGGRGATTGGTDMNLPGAFAVRLNTKSNSTTGLVSRRPKSTSESSKYVDGKTTFAFDPSKFS